MPEKKMELQPGTRRFYWVLFKSTFLISAFTVGGGMVIIPLLKSKFVDEYGWIDDKETLDIVAIDASIMLGYRMSGLMGTMVTLMATILPPLITMSLIALCYDLFAHNQYIQLVLKGMQCGATAIIINVVINLVQKLFKKKLLLPCLIFLGTMVAVLAFDVNLMYCVIVDGLIGLALLRNPKYN